MIAEAPRLPLRADDLTRLRWAIEPAIDASGHRLAYVESGPDAASDRVTYGVRTVDVRRGTSSALDDAVRTRRPRWSAHGRLAVLAETGDAWQVALVDLDSGTLDVAGPVPGDVRSFAWSPDGGAIVCEVIVPPPGGASQVWLIDLAARQPRRLTPDGCGDSRGPAGRRTDGRSRWSRRTPAGSAVWLVDPASGRDAKRVTTARGAVRGLSWSPDGTTVAYLGQKSRSTLWSNDELWVVDVTDGAERRLGAGLDRSIGHVVRGDDERGTGAPGLAWTPTGDAVIAAFADGGTSAIASFPLHPGTDAEWQYLVVGGERAVLEFDVATATGAIAFTWSDPFTPGEVTVRSPDGAERRCSDLGRTITDASPIVGTERIVHVADDGARIDGWLTVPPSGRDPVPLVVQIHGGPHYPVGLRFSFDAQRWVGHGFALLRANPRGSQGYGADFAAGIHGDWGGRDFRDVMGLVDTVLAGGRFDPRRLAIVGESYGGYLTMWSITRTGRFAAAVSENGISDLVAAARHNPQFWSDELALPPGEQPDRVRERSPITAAADVTTPLLAVHAEHDTVSPIAQSEAMVAELARHGCVAELLVAARRGPPRQPLRASVRSRRQAAADRRVPRSTTSERGPPTRRSPTAARDRRWRDEDHRRRVLRRPQRGVAAHRRVDPLHQ